MAGLCNRQVAGLRGSLSYFRGVTTSSGFTVFVLLSLLYLLLNLPPLADVVEFWREKNRGKI